MDNRTEIKSRVLEATNIVELIQRTVPLTKRGKDYLGLCPFHQEKTPSFHVSPAKQFFYCFGCKKNGNAIDFVMERDRSEFKDALRQLAEAAGIPMPDFKRDKGGTDPRGEASILRDIQVAACSFFEKILAHPENGKIARQYLAKRGFTNQSISQFNIGLAPDSWDAFLTSPQAKKFAPGQLALAGLVKARDNGGGFYDAFRNRIMFPIRDVQGRIIAFGGRVLPGSDDKIAKYLNSPQTPLFDKGSCAFGLDLAKDKILETRSVAVVEGYTDVVMAHQFGCTNVVSTLGTALTPQHVKLLGRWADRVVLVFDPDPAGQAAADRAVELFLTQDKEIAVAALPDGLDPDEVLLKQGADAFNAVLASAGDALTYAWKQLNGKFAKRANDMTGQKKAVQEYLELLGSARKSGHVDPLRWGAAIHRVSRLTGMPADQLHRQFKTQAAPNRRTTHSQPSQKPKTEILNAQDRAESFIMGYLLCEPGRWAQTQTEISPGDFTDVRRQALAEIYWRHQQDEGEPVFNQFLTLIEEPSIKEMAVQLAQEAQTRAEPSVYFESCLEYIRSQRARMEQERCAAQLRGTTDPNGSAPDSRTQPVDEAAVLQQLSDFSRKPDPRRMSVRYSA